MQSCTHIYSNNLIIQKILDNGVGPTKVLH